MAQKCEVQAMGAYIVKVQNIVTQDARNTKCRGINYGVHRMRRKVWEQIFWAQSIRVLNG